MKLFLNLFFISILLSYFCLFKISPVRATTYDQTSYRWSNDNSPGEFRLYGGWFDFNWNYRQTLTINNATGSTLTAFQVGGSGFKIATNGYVSGSKMQNDCDDIRFTNSVGDTLSYWVVDSRCNSSTTPIYIKTDSIGASGVPKEIFMYYGNSLATAGSNGTATFEFFDDFNDGSIDTTTRWNTFGTPKAEVGGTLSIGRGGSLAGWNLLVTRGSTMVDGVIENRFIHINGDLLGNPRNDIFARTTNNNVATVPDAAGSVKTEDGTYSGWRHVIAIANTVRATSNWSSSMTTWYTSSIKLAGQYIGFTTYSDYFGTQLASIGTTYAHNNSGYFGLGTYNNDRNLWDWFLLRKAATTEPSVSLGSETTKPEYLPGATWKAAENTAASAYKGENVRVRFSIKNNGTSGSTNYRLQVAPLGAAANCEAVASGNFTDVPTSAGSAVAVMSATPYVTDQTATTNQLDDSAATFVSGYFVSDTSNQTNSITLNTGQFTEAEYSFKMTANAVGGSTYCFRVYDVAGAAALSSYTKVATLNLGADNIFRIIGTAIKGVIFR